MEFLQRNVDPPELDEVSMQELERRFLAEMQKMDKIRIKEAMEDRVRQLRETADLLEKKPTTLEFVHRQQFAKTPAEMKTNFADEMNRLNEKAAKEIDEHVREFSDEIADPAESTSLDATSIAGIELDRLRLLVCEQALEISKLKKMVTLYKKKSSAQNVASQKKRC